MKGLLSTGRWTGRFAVLACIFALPFLRFLLQNDYPLLRMEAVAGAALLAVPCLLLALLCRPRLLFAVVVLAGILLMSATTVLNLLPGEQRLRWVLLGLACVLIPAMVWMREAFFRLLLIFAAGAFAVDIVQSILPRAGAPAEHAPAAHGALPHIVYIVFDQHLGLGAFPDDIPECRQARDRLQNTLLRHGFNIYPNAFTNYSATLDSIPSILRGKLVDRTHGFLRTSGGAHTLQANRLFSRFHSEGYRLEVYQSDFLRFCPPGLDCREFTYKANSIAAIVALPIRWTHKLHFISASYLTSDAFLSDVARSALPVLRDVQPVYVGPLAAAVIWPDPLTARIIKADRKTLFFAHLLTPHYPYVYTADGARRDLSQWGSDLGLRLSDPALYRLQYQRYAGQVEYLARQIDGFLTQLEKISSYESSLIVLHGDHGSRLRLMDESQRRVAVAAQAAFDHYDYTSTPDLQDLLNRFSTLLAIKLPASHQGRIIPRKASVLRILTELFDPGRAASLPPTADEVYLIDDRGVPRAIPILKQWTDPPREEM